MAVPMNEFELQRQLRIAENNRRLEELGIMSQKAIVHSFCVNKKPKSVAPSGKKPKQARLSRFIRAEPRRSRRLLGDQVDYCEIGDNDECVRVQRSGDGDADSHGGCGLLDLMERQSSHTINPEQQEQLQQIRCVSQGRGSLYDSSVGITCHFCRQKKLCGEQDCPRCQHRDADKECIGKTDCSRCHSAFGKFCRACLLIRYGYELEEVRKQMAEGVWLCPHCYEDEHPDEGLICNSSICMKRRGLKPTGIAIYEAQERGFKSVAHLLQAQLNKRGGVAALQREADGTTAGPATTAAEATTSGQQQPPADATTSGQQQSEATADPSACQQQALATRTRRSCRAAATAATPGPAGAGGVSKKVARKEVQPKVAPARKLRARS